MDIRFSGKNLTMTTGIKEHIREKLTKFERYAPRLVESHVILIKEKYLYKSEITLLAKHFRAYGEGASKANIYAAIDQAYDRVEKQLKKYREKMKDHYKGLNGKVEAVAGTESLPRQRLEVEAAEFRPAIIPAPAFAGKPMSVEEASLQLSLSQDSFLVFQNSVTSRVNVLYKRNDGNHGLIEPDLKS